MYVMNDDGIIHIKKYQYLWKEYALNIELKLNRFVPVWKQEHAKLQEARYINPFSTEPSAVFLLLEPDNLGVIH